MKIKTKTGTEFECDMVAENPSPPRLYLHILNSSVGEVAAAFTDASELPIDGYPDYTAFQSVSVTPEGVNVTMKKPGT